MTEQDLTDPDWDGLEDQETDPDWDGLEDEEASPIAQRVAHLLKEGTEVGATTIHLDPAEDRSVTVRLRVGGTLRASSAGTIPVANARGVIARLKIIADLNIAERKVPQDGMFTTRIEDEECSWGVSTLPGRLGEKVTIRRIPTSGPTATLAELGFCDDDRARIMNVLEAGRGLVLVAGSRDGGPEEVLDTFVQAAAKAERSLVSIEADPRPPTANVHCVLINPAIRITWATALREAIRGDADVIRIGTMHDFETARRALEASLEGRLILATIPTIDAPSGVARLLEMGIPPFLVAHGLVLVLAVRKVRRLCPECRVPDEGGTFGPGGCDSCADSGYNGEVGIFEVIDVGQAIPAGILTGDWDQTARMVREWATSLRSTSLRDAGLLRVQAGDTSMAEVLLRTPDP